MNAADSVPPAPGIPADADYYRLQLETVAENATLALFIMDEHQRCTYMNRAAEEMTGFRLGELQGKALHYYIHHTRPDGSHYPLEECPIDQAFPQNMREHGEEVFVHKDGHLYPVKFTASPIRKGERTVGTIIEAREITKERERAARAKREQDRYRFLAETIPAQVWTARPDGRLDYVNERTARYFGVPAEQVLEDGWQTVLHPDDLPAAVERWVRSLATGDRYEVEFRLRRSDGEYRWHLARADAMRDDAGGITTWFGVNTDVHAQRQAEGERDLALSAAERERERLARIFKDAPAFIATVRGPDHVFEMANAVYAQLVGHREILGKPVREALPEAVEQGFVGLLDQVYRSGEPFVGNGMRISLQRTPGGAPEERFLNFVYQPLVEDDGSVSGILAHGVDVTEQVEAQRLVEEQAAELEAQREELLHQAMRMEEVQVELEVSNEELQQANDEIARERAHLAAIIEHAPVGIIIAEAPAGRLIQGNRRLEEIFRHPMLSSGTLDEYREWVAFHPDGRQVEAREYPLSRVLTTGEAAGPDEYLYRRGDGTDGWVQITSVPVRNDRGEMVSAVAVIDDVDAERRAQGESARLIRELEVERARLRAILTEAPAQIAVVRGPDYVFDFANPPYLASVGDREIMGRPALEALHELADQGFKELLDEAYTTGRTIAVNEIPAAADRHGTGELEEGFYNLVLQPLTDAHGRVEAILSHTIDVTGQVRARHDVERKADELAQAARALEASNRELDQFAYVASHDLKAPLRGISNISTWIEEDLGSEAGPEVKEHLALLRGRVHRMEGLIDGILQYSRAGRVREPLKRVHTGELVAEVTELIAPPQSVRIRVAEGMPEILTERLPLQQVFMNLIGNAVKYARGSEPLVQVSAREVEAGWEFAVADNGPGIAPEYHERIFGIFQMLEARDKVEGTGIGLSIVKKLVDSRGGQVWVESEEGAGSTFRFLWPNAREETPGE